MKKRLGRITAVVGMALLCLVLTACVASINGNQDPTANFTSDQEDGTFRITFDGSSSFDPDGEIALWNWNFGDGSPGGSGETVVHPYADPGTYSVRLIIQDNDGASDEITKDVTVVAPDPIPTDPITVFRCTLLSQVQSGSRIRFDAKKSTDPDGQIVWGRWDFGDGSTVEGPWTEWRHDAHGVWTEFSVMRVVTYLYTVPNLYTIILTVMDNDGNRVSASRQIRVRK